MPTFPSTLTANLALTVPSSLVLDLNTIWLAAKNGPVVMLADAVAATDTTVTVTAVVGVTANSSILIDGEPMIVTGIDSTGLIYTVARAANAYPFLAMLPTQPPNTHAAGAGVFAMLYETPWQMLANCALRPWVAQQVMNLGASSATFGTAITGSLAVGS